ncbi:uncharacterized protein BO96DRAFT_414544 [Aspergillus niger CBS 101883]|uniref:uncharacterized protein n=1 Tax=Aspergillus lacticoffeatus (strain CBS 101883) TaxID=1450533 RepID=UPI000D7FEB15|nr:uncharacterized protein BO96DRAFT_414544 [Aspergillus niger CBS 101883]PYH53888.1 hypothetical protein BO96DRAFT_414544 [Aspergillus niger CBS 101883]
MKTKRVGNDRALPSIPSITMHHFISFPLSADRPGQIASCLTHRTSPEVAGKYLSEPTCTR